MIDSFLLIVAAFLSAASRCYPSSLHCAIRQQHLSVGILHYCQAENPQAMRYDKEVSITFDLNSHLLYIDNALLAYLLGDFLGDKFRNNSN